MEIPSEAVAGFAAFLAIGLWEIWRPQAGSQASVGWRWASHLIVYVAGGFAAGWLVATIIGPAWKTGLPDTPDFPLVALAAVFGVLVLDLERYWLHRLLHGVPMLWRCHALHHSDREIDVSTGYRHHPFEIVVVALVLPLSALALAIPGTRYHRLRRHRRDGCCFSAWQCQDSPTARTHSRASDRHSGHAPGPSLYRPKRGRQQLRPDLLILGPAVRDLHEAGAGREPDRVRGRGIHRPGASAPADDAVDPVPDRHKARFNSNLTRGPERCPRIRSVG